MISTLAWTISISSLAAWTVGALLAVGKRPLLVSLGTLPPERRARWTLALLVVPTLAGAAVFAAILLPSVLGFDHCLEHDDAHLHLCLNHPAASGAYLVPFVVMLLVRPLRAAFRAIADFSAQRSQSRALGQLGRLDGDIVRVPSPALFSFVEPSLRPRVFVTDGLFNALSEPQLAIVLAHERAHVRRREPVLRLLAHACSGFVPRDAREKLLASFVLSSERSCDEAAAEGTTRLSVAEVLLTLVRAGSYRPRVPLIAMGEDCVRERIEALCNEPPAEPRWRELVRWTTVVAAASLLLATGHHLIETLIGHVL